MEHASLGEDQLSATQNRRDVANLHDMHPADGAIQILLAGDHLGRATAQSRQLQGRADGQGFGHLPIVADSAHIAAERPKLLTFRSARTQDA